MKRATKAVVLFLNDLWHSAVIDVGYVLESYGYNSSFQGLKFVKWWGMALMKDMVKRGTALWIVKVMDIDLCMQEDLNR